MSKRKVVNSNSPCNWEILISPLNYSGSELIQISPSATRKQIICITTLTADCSLSWTGALGSGAKLSTNPKLVQISPKIIQKWSQNGHKWSKNCPIMVQKRSHISICNDFISRLSAVHHQFMISLSSIHDQFIISHHQFIISSSSGHHQFIISSWFKKKLSS